MHKVKSSSKRKSSSRKTITSRSAQSENESDMKQQGCFSARNYSECPQCHRKYAADTDSTDMNLMQHRISPTFCVYCGYRMSLHNFFNRYQKCFNYSYYDGSAGDYP